ncbi:MULTISPECIES: NIPSNAP family protein [unclassified Caballeronia]|uniref:NIPSNAP family protein n=1 Tax=unclassified Caballeronia TaxID=2646786 RepID=UPI001F3AD5B9|nr:MULTISPECIES: NIPSNAP family protein [unclassified Caballeronia]MCE4546065.1 NIPSNAP family protein [Caballeronia sp. PC1]MCE4573462.1 NIPSNAP family protein [Caballeronia sp. CLC5]
MLIEHRAYTLRPGTSELFWEAQRERGEHGLQAILARLIGAFSTRTGVNDQIVSLYRYDDFDDWQSRLLGLYGRKELLPYFAAVRPLIVRQESSFLTPAPLSGWTPHWGNGQDWLGDRGRRIMSRRGSGVVEEFTLTFSAGGVQMCWEAMGRHRVIDDSGIAAGLIGAFSTIAGELNRVLFYWHFPDLHAWSDHCNSRQTSERWTGFLRELGSHTLAAGSRLLDPSRVADMSPFFDFG